MMKCVPFNFRLTDFDFLNPSRIYYLVNYTETDSGWNLHDSALTSLSIESEKKNDGLHNKIMMMPD